MDPRKRSLVATMVLVLCVLALLARHALLAATPIGIALQALAALLMLWARLTFGMRSFHAGATPTAGGARQAHPTRARLGPFRDTTDRCSRASRVSHAERGGVAVECHLDQAVAQDERDGLRDDLLEPELRFSSTARHGA